MSATPRNEKLRNIAIIAHVDHGKTTLVDHLLRQAGTFRANQEVAECVMDSNDLERERGITILAKNCAIQYGETKINIIDTPGHADFGGEVERVLKMADGCLLLVDAAEGVLPQTKFVLRKAFGHGLRPIVVVNKIDRADARPHEVLDQVFDLFVELQATDQQLDFPYVFAAGRLGFAKLSLEEESQDLKPLFELILKHVPAPAGDAAKPMRLQVSNIDYNDYVGRIAIGRIWEGAIRRGQVYTFISTEGARRRERVVSLQVHEGLGRRDVERAEAGEIVAISGFPDIGIGDSILEREDLEPLPPVPIDEPTLTMVFTTNTSPFSGREGRFVTSRQLEARLERERQRNVAMRIAQLEPDVWEVAGRGLLHLSVLIETMRREGYEVAIGKPHVIEKEIGGAAHEPFETVTVDVPEAFMGKVMELLGARQCVLEHMSQREGQCHLEFVGPSRGLIGLRSRLLSATKGEAVLHHSYRDFRPVSGELPGRVNGVLAASDTGRVTAYALMNLQDRGEFFVEPGEEVYQGQIVGETGGDKDIAVNVTKEKHLTNIRSSNKEATEKLKTKTSFSLEEALEYIEEDELIEATPKSVRLRKRMLNEKDRLRGSRQKAQPVEKA
ncbi:MAG: translational GTPase TypA [Planctomycetota bacterium]|nr:translational GTPase TypA [Planctomycetota bacterium]